MFSVAGSKYEADAALRNLLQTSSKHHTIAHRYTHIYEQSQKYKLSQCRLFVAAKEKEERARPIIQRRLICQPANLFQISHPRKRPEGRSQKRTRKRQKATTQKTNQARSSPSLLYNSKNVYLCSRRNELKRRRMTSPNNACMIRPDPIPSRYKRRMPLPIFKAVRDVFPVLSWILLSPYILYQQHLVLCDLDTSSCSKSLLDVTVDSELTGLECTSQ